MPVRSQGAARRRSRRRQAAGWFGQRSLRPLGAVLRTALLAILHALRVEHAAEDVVADAGEVLDAAAADHHHRMFLEIVALTWDVADHFEADGEADFGDLAQRRVRLLRRGRINAGADPAFLRAFLHRRHLVALYRRDAGLANELVYGRHSLPICLDPTKPKAPCPPFWRRRSFNRGPRLLTAIMFPAQSGV